MHILYEYVYVYVYIYIYIFIREISAEISFYLSKFIRLIRLTVLDGCRKNK